MSPAKKWLRTEVDAAARRELSALFVEAQDELARATAKFPEFPGTFAPPPALESLPRVLKRIREMNDGAVNATAYSIFGEEWLEFVEAVAVRRDKAAARTELIQAMAMLLRMWQHVDAYVAVKKGR